MTKEIIRFTDTIYGIKEDFVTAHLVIGEEKAVLFDTGIETGLKEEVGKITSLPVSVYHTHSDGDHMAADREFKEVYMHPAEYDHCKDKELALRPVWEGEVITVGEYAFKAILIPGHTPGSVAYFDEEKGILFPGDFVPEETEEFMFGGGRNIRAYRESLKKISMIKNRIKVIYQPHGKAISDSSIIDDYLEMTDLIIEGKLEGEETEIFDRKVTRAAYKRASILI